MQPLTWVEGTAPLTCKVCQWSGDGSLTATVRRDGGDLIHAVTCPQCGSIDLLDDPLDCLPTDESIDQYVEVGAGITAIAAAFGDIDPTQVKRFLDVGGSYGFAMDIARHVYGWTVVGVDPSLSAERGAQELGLDIRREMLTAETDLGEPFDLILASEVVEHVVDPLEFLSVLRSHLAPTGSLVLTTPAAEIVTRESAENEALCALSPGNHTFVATAPALRSLLERAGFADIHVVRAGGTLRVRARMTPTDQTYEPAGVDAEALTSYLAARTQSAPKGSALAVGTSVRLGRELLARGEFRAAARAAKRMRAAFKARHGLDFRAPGKILARLDEGDDLPWSATSAAFVLGCLELFHRQRHERAATYLDLTTRLAESSWTKLDVVDLDTADLRFQGAYFQAFARTYFDPEGAADLALRFDDYRGVTTQASSVIIHGRMCRIFVELVARGHYAAAGRLRDYVEGVAPLSARDTGEARVAGLDALFSLGILKRLDGDERGAQACFLECLAVSQMAPSADQHAQTLIGMCGDQLATGTASSKSLGAGDAKHAIDAYWSDAWGTFVAGWAHLGATPVSQISVEVDGLTLLAEPQDRPDLLTVWPDLPDLVHAGFSVYVPRRVSALDLVVHTDGAHARIHVELPDRPKPEWAPQPAWVPVRELTEMVRSAIDGPALALGVRSVSEDVAGDRTIVLEGREIVGFDIHPGFGVDVVGDAHRLGSYFPDEKFAVVYSASLLEHVSAPWLVAAECAKVLKPGGLAIHLAPWVWPTHAEPNDFWRFSDRGMEALFSEHLGFRIVASGGVGGTIMTPTPDWRLTQLRYPTIASPAMSWVVAEKVAEPDASVAWPYADADVDLARQYPVDGLSAETFNRKIP